MNRVLLANTSAALPITWSLVLFISLPCAAHVGASHEEPFDSFRRLDSKLSVLQNQFTEVRRGVQMGAPAETKEWRDAVHASSKTALSIQAIAKRLTTRYRRKRERFGAKVFGRFEQRASSVRRDLARLESSTGAVAKTKAAENTSASIVKLIEQYQAVSAGYENSHCNRGQPCCSPRKPANPGSPLGCKWECVTKRATCRKGFSGTRLGSVTP